MKHLTRISVVLALVAVMVLVPALTALAQGDNPLCSGLSDADCQLLTGSTAAAATVKSFSLPSWSIDLTYDAGTNGTGSFSAKGSGQLMLPADLTDPTLAGLLVHLVGLLVTSIGGVVAWLAIRRRRSAAEALPEPAG